MNSPSPTAPARSLRLPDSQASKAIEPHALCVEEPYSDVFVVSRQFGAGLVLPAYVTADTLIEESYDLIGDRDLFGHGR